MEDLQQTQAGLEEMTDEQKKEMREKLKERARMLNIGFANNVSNAKLAELIEKRLNNEPLGDEGGDTADTAEAGEEEPTPTVAKAKVPETMAQLRMRLRKEATKLVRVMIVVHNPSKQDLDGEFFTVANELIGTVRRFVPFGEKAANGWHIEQCIYDHLKSRKYQHIQSLTGRHGKRDETIIRDANEFTLTILPPLTKEEIAELAQDQRLRRATED